MVDEYTLTCDKELELNRLYVIFSPNLFSKAVDSQSDATSTPRMLGFSEYQKWLSNSRMRDTQMSLNIINLTITK